MGGAKEKHSRATSNHRRAIHSNEQLSSVIIELAKENIDELPFSARAVAIKAGKSSTSPIITRDRGGLKQFICDIREAFVSELQLLIDAEMENYGEISLKFCRSLGFLIVSYSLIFELDIILESHHNIQVMVGTLQPLIREAQLLFFGAELYRLLDAWSKESFSRASVLAGYDEKLRSLFIKYQIRRPDMSVGSRGHVGSFFMKQNEKEDHETK